MVVLGYDSTVPVTMDEMIHHCKAVRRGAQYAYLIGDLPFMSYQADRAEAVCNAGRFLKEAGMDAVKLEGGRQMADTVRAITDAGMTVVGHIGLTPQSVGQIEVATGSKARPRRTPTDCWATPWPCKRPARP